MTKKDQRLEIMRGKKGNLQTSSYLEEERQKKRQEGGVLRKEGTQSMLDGLDARKLLFMLNLKSFPNISTYSHKYCP